MYLCTVNNIVANNTNGMKNKTTTDLYVDDLMLRGDTTLLWRFGGGYVELNANGTPTSWNYYITDHLGSTRMVVDSNDRIESNIPGIATGFGSVKPWTREQRESEESLQRERRKMNESLSNHIGF